MSAPRLCLVSPSHVSANPRLVKEANALHAAGYRVHVVAGRYYPPLDRFDTELLGSAPWEFTQVDYTAGLRTRSLKLLRHAARAWVGTRRVLSLALAKRAWHVAIPRLGRAGADTASDLYIGHTLAGLAGAARASRLSGTRFGFDAEDFHAAETVQSARDPVDQHVIGHLEGTLLPHCTTFTASSPLIAAAYQERYDLTRFPTVVLNTFDPVNGIDPGASPTFVAHAPRRLYWFSQTIGPGRGLEQLLPILAAAKTPASLHLRGIASAAYQQAFGTAARRMGFQGPIEWLPFAPPPEMIPAAVGMDAGLSLEETVPLNRDLCLTNKVFTYLAAGLPTILSPTRAQTALASDLGSAALLLPWKETERSAAMLDEFLSEPHLGRAHRAAVGAAAQRFSWAQESKELLAEIERGLSSRTAAPAESDE